MVCNLNHIRGIFFDLDGTLLEVEMKKFIPAYLGALASCFEDVADRRTFMDVLLMATSALLRPRSEGATETNEALFLTVLQRHLGIDPHLFASRFRSFCGKGLQGLAAHIRPLPLARSILRRSFERGLKVAIATNPVFPRPVIEARLAWGNLHDFPFAHISTFENSRYCKPDPNYYRELMATLQLSPGECLMVGNDTEHDLAAREAGIRTFLVDTWLVDRVAGSFVTDFRGGHQELLQLVGHLGTSGGIN